MAHVQPSVARALVLRRLPRFLRVALADRWRYAALRSDLAEELARIDPTAGTAATEFVGDGSPPAHPGLAMLDAYAAIRDRVAISEIVDTLLVLARPFDGHPTVPRLAKTAWREVDRLDEAETRLAAMSLVEALSDGGSSDLDELSLDDFMRNAVPGRSVDLEAARRAWKTAIAAALDELRHDAIALAVGLSSLPVATSSDFPDDTVAETALRLGQAVLTPIVAGATRAEQRRDTDRVARIARRLASAARRSSPPPPTFDPPAAVEIPQGHLIVCPAATTTGSQRSREVTKGYEHVIGKPVPLVGLPNLSDLRDRLGAEFPHAVGTLDTILARLIGKTEVRLPPLLIVGAPGIGKSAFVGRLAEELGVGLTRVDGSNDAGASYGGTERRWFSSEPCRPLMAIARHRQANPVVFVDEIDKAPVRADYGRLWDSMLGTLGGETSSRYPDPCLQAPVDISAVSVICAANDERRLPAPLLDRLTLVRFDTPRRTHLPTLLPGILARISADAGMDRRFLEPISPVELDALGRHWRGGSLRHLSRLVEGLLRVRERSALRLPN